MYTLLTRRFGVPKMFPTISSVELLDMIYALAGERPDSGPWTIDVADLERALIDANAIMTEVPTKQPPEQDALGMP